MGTIARSDNIKSKSKLKRKRAFDAQVFLDSAGVAKKVREAKKAEAIYSQGDAAESVMYLQKGGVKLTVVNEDGKEAVVAILGPGDFFGEGCLAGQPIRMGTASATTPSTVLIIEKGEMLKVLHDVCWLVCKTHDSQDAC
jgi:CRP/FNR family cyclic AMP-dependent transcriptional regulator